MTRKRSCQILDPPNAHAALLNGMEQITALVRPTLGPVGGAVAIAGPTSGSVPEVLTNAATISRRVIQIDDPFADMGAMLLRQLLWHVDEAVGDGGATAAVLCSEMLRAAQMRVVAGISPMELKRGLDRGVDVAQTEIRRQCRPIHRPSELAGMVSGTLEDPRHAEMVGEIVEAVGADGTVRIEDTRASTTSYDFVQGSRWESGCLSYALMPDGVREALLDDPQVLVVDFRLEVEHLVPVLERCISAGHRTLLVVAPSLSDAAVGLLVRNRDAGVLQAVMAVQAPGRDSHRQEVLDDIVAITGGRVFGGAAGDSLRQLALHDLGTARQAWATSKTFGILGGGGDLGMRRQRVHAAKTRFAEHGIGNADRRQLQGRIAALAGSSAIVRVGAPTAPAQKALRAKVEAAVRTARAALREGAVPGGGASLVGTLPALERLCQDLPESEAQGVRVLMRAMEAPLRCILVNAGIEPELIVHDARECCPAKVFDVRRRTWVDPWQEGIVDPVSVLITALIASASAAMMALSTDVLVRRKSSPVSFTP